MAMRKRSFPTARSVESDYVSVPVGQSVESYSTSGVRKWPRNVEKSEIPVKYRDPTELTDTVLIVEDEKFHVSKLVSKVYL